MTTGTRADAAQWGVHLRGASIDDVLGGLDDGLVGRWASVWPAWSERTALVAEDEEHISYDRLASESAQAAARLRRAGAGPGDRVLVSGPTATSTAVAVVGALRAGLVVVPTHTAYRERELAHLVHDSRPTLALLADADQRCWFDELAPGAPCSDLELSELPSATSGDDRVDEARGDDPAFIAYTSGTTGRPKGTVLTHRNVLADLLAVSHAWGWQPDDRLLLCLPFFHLHGLGAGLLGTLTNGGSTRLARTFDAASLLDVVVTAGATMLFGVPTMYRDLAAHSAAAALGRLRICVSGSAPLPVDLFEAVRRATGEPVLERYGATETLINVSNPLVGERRAGSIGTALPSVSVCLDGDRDRDEGEIWVRGPNVSPGYWEDPAATSTSRVDGWFRTGDIGRWDPDGYLRIVGRARELVISGGYNVYPREVEDVLRRHPAVLDAAVLGRPSDRWGEEVTAFVVLSEPSATRELEAFAREELVFYKVPKRFVVVDSLPRNALGKVLKHELVDDSGG